jgi:rubrerythrin
MKYYLHDSNSFNDEKITELYLEFGYEGLGLFYTILEKLALQEKPIKTIVLKHQLNVGKKLEKCWQFMEQIDLISSNNGETFNKQLLNFSQKYQVSKEKNAKRILEWRENQALKENVTHSESVRNADKVKESKVKESKVKESKESFSEMLSPYIQDLNSEYDNFFSYWTEKNSRGKERWESEKFFDISRRINTWMQNQNKFGNNKPSTNSEPGPGKMTKGLLQQQEIYNELLEQIENGTYVNPFSSK